MRCSAINLRINLSKLKAPTVVPFPHFNAAEDGDKLRTAMQCIDDRTIINILTTRTNDQRQQIANYFHRKFGRNLIEDLTSGLNGNLQKVALALMRTPAELNNMELHKALTNQKHELAEILCSSENKDILGHIKSYEQRELLFIHAANARKLRFGIV